MVWPVLKRLDHFKTVQVCNWSVTFSFFSLTLSPNNLLLGLNLIYIYIYIYMKTDGVCLTHSQITMGYHF